MMTSSLSTAMQAVIEIRHPGQVGEVRRQAQSLAARLNFSEDQLGRLALIVTEAGTNIAKHAAQGRILLRGLQREGGLGLEILALDSGPGMANVSESLRDGRSTTGTSGTGLGALARLSDDFDIYSRPGKGTAICCELWVGRAPATTGLFKLGTVCIPKSGEEVCGDGWVVREDRDRMTVLLVDGLGHGTDAAAAARVAIDVVERHPRPDAAELTNSVHGALRSTRGAAAALAVFRPDDEAGDFCGVGNIIGQTRFNMKSRNLVSHNGILGHQVRKIQAFGFPLPPSGVLILHSDGLSNRWNLDDYAGLEFRHPSLIAGVLYRDFRRERDDATIVVLRFGGDA